MSSTELLSTSDLEEIVSFISLTSSTHFLLFTFITSSRNFCTSFLSREKSLTCFDSLSDWTGDLIIGRGCSRLSISSFRRIISPRNTSSSAAEFIGVGGGGGSTKSILVGLLRLSWLRRFGDWLRRLCGRRWTTVSASVKESFLKVPFDCFSNMNNNYLWFRQWSRHWIVDHLRLSTLSNVIHRRITSYGFRLLLLLLRLRFTRPHTWCRRHAKRGFAHWFRWAGPTLAFGAGRRWGGMDDHWLWLRLALLLLLTTSTSRFELREVLIQCFRGAVEGLWLGAECKCLHWTVVSSNLS